MANFTGSMPLILDALVDRDRPRRSGGDPAPEVGTFAALLRAFLGRSGDDRAVSNAIEMLRETSRLDPAALAAADPVGLVDGLRTAGAGGLVKAVAPLLRVAVWAASTFVGEPDDRLDDGSRPTEALRDGLRGLKGIGPATADAMLLEGLGRPSYPVDRATYRIMVRHGWIDPGADYDEARSLVEGALPDDPLGMLLLSRGFERLGREACRVGVARCDRCPLRSLLPEGGPLGDAG